MIICKFASIEDNKLTLGFFLRIDIYIFCYSWLKNIASIYYCRWFKDFSWERLISYCWQDAKTLLWSVKQHAGRATKGKRIYLCIAKIERRASKFTTALMILNWKMYCIILINYFLNSESCTPQASLVGLLYLYSTENN